MKVPFFDISKQYEALMNDVEGELSDIFKECLFIGGPHVKKFEEDMQEYLGVKHAIGCGNGTDALVLALRACGVCPGDEVITTSFSYFATAEAIASVGAIPVFVDILISDYMIDPSKIEDAITERTKVILPVQIFGGCCDMDKIMKIARKYKLRVIEDDAQAIGATYKEKKAGTLADIGCFSFYPTKNLGGCGDGGMCTTDNDNLALIIKALREHGGGKIGGKAYELLTGKPAGKTTEEKATALYDPQKYFNYLIGYNSRLDAIQAAVLSIKLKHLPEYNSRRAEIAREYTARLTTNVWIPAYSPDVVPCWHQFAIMTDRNKELGEYLANHGIGSGTFYPVPLHKQMAFDSNNSRVASGEMRIVDIVTSKIICLPIYPEMTDKQVDYVIETVNGFYQEEKK